MQGPGPGQCLCQFQCRGQPEPERRKASVCENKFNGLSTTSGHARIFTTAAVSQDGSREFWFTT